MSVSNTTEKRSFTTTLVKNSYGKSHVRLTKINREGPTPTWREITVETELVGPEFAGCYYEGDNSKIVATDSIKNTVYVEASKHSLNSIEEFALHLAKHYLSDYAHVSEATIYIEENVWAQIPVNGSLHPTSFVKSREDMRVATVRMDRKRTIVESGIENMVVAKITNSEFSGFIRDKYTTLKDTSDRILGTKVIAHWTYNNQNCDFNAAYENARRIMLETFAQHHSLSAQQTLYAMGDAVLNAIKDVDEISMTLPNLHRIPFDLKPFGLENKNEIFTNTIEPYGIIKGTVSRKK